MKGIIVVVVIVAVAAVVFALLPQLQGYGIRTLPGRFEDLSEPEPEAFGYVARPPAELGRQLVSPWVSEHSKETAWGNARGKWVLWKGRVHSVEPALNPNRIVLVYEHEAPPPFHTQRFGVVVGFGAQWSARLKQLTVGDFTYFRARLAEAEFRLADVYRYGLDFSSHVLLLEQGQIVEPDDIAAALVDLAYAGFEQLDELVRAAECIAAVSEFFEGKLRDGRKRIAIETIIKLVGIDIRDKYWLLGHTPLAELRASRDWLKFDIEQRVQEALEVLHYAGPVKSAALRDSIEKQARYNRTAVEASKDACGVLRGFWEEERRSAQPSISDLALELLLMKLPRLIAVVKTIMEGIIECGELDAYEIIVGACHLQLEMIAGHMEHIHAGVIDIARSAVQEAR